MNVRKKNNDLTSLRDKRKLDLPIVYGKVPPQAKDLEEAVLGALMLQKDAYDEISTWLSADQFYVEAHQRIYKAIQRLAQKNQPIDILTVAEELRSTEELELVGGAYYVTKLTNAVVSSANIIPHSRIILQKWMKRELVRLGSILIGDGYDDTTDPFDIIDDFEKDFSQLSNVGNQETTSHITDVMVPRIQRLAELMKNDSHLTGIPSGFNELDKVTHGWQKTDLIILAARPAVGKTAFALNIARNACKTVLPSGKRPKALIFSLEMSKGQLVDRMMSAESEVWLDKIMTGHGVDQEIMGKIYREGVQPLSKYGIFIDDTPSLNVFQLKTKAKAVIKKAGKTDDWLIIIDYLQLMSGVDDRNNNNREQEVSRISRNLKGLAKELNIPVIALSQLSREVEKRKGQSRTPQLSDLRESGAIEQDADMVMFIYRPEYYEIDVEGDAAKGLTEISIAKHRSGNLATGSNAIKLKALLHIQKFISWEESQEVGPYTAPVSPLGSGNWRPVNIGDKMNPNDIDFQ